MASISATRAPVLAAGRANHDALIVFRQPTAPILVMNIDGGADFDASIRGVLLLHIFGCDADKAARGV